MESTPPLLVLEEFSIGAVLDTKRHAGPELVIRKPPHNPRLEPTRALTGGSRRAVYSTREACAAVGAQRPRGSSAGR